MKNQYNNYVSLIKMKQQLYEIMIKIEAKISSIEQLIKIIQEEIAKELANDPSLVNEIYDLDQVKYSASVRKEVESLVSALEKTPNLNKQAVASILNDIILALGLNRTQITMYMNMIKQQRKKYDF